MARKLFLTVLAAMLLAFTVSGTVFAHVSPVSTSPVSGDRVGLLPGQYDVTFAGVVDATFASAELISPAGVRYPLDTISTGQVEQVVFVLGETGLDEPGTWVFSWTVLALDGHTMTDDVGFGVRADPADIVSEGSNSVSGVLRGIARSAVWVGLIGVVGMLFWAKPERSLWMVAVLLGGVALSAGVAVWTALESGLSRAEQYTGFTTGAQVAMWCVVGVAGLWWLTGRQRYALVSVVGSAMFALAATSHLGSRGWAGTVVSFAHVAAAAVWVGTVVVGVLLARGGARVDWGRVKPAALAAAGVLAVSGTISVRELNDNLSGGGWLSLLGVKLAVLAVVVVPLGAWNMRHAKSGPSTARSVVVESVGLCVVVLGGIVVAQIAPL